MAEPSTTDMNIIPYIEHILPRTKPLEISLPLPKSLHTTAHIHLTFLDTSAMVFLTTTTPGDSAGCARPMGSFVYAMPDVRIIHPFVIFYFVFLRVYPFSLSGGWVDWDVLCIYIPSSLLPLCPGTSHLGCVQMTMYPTELPSPFIRIQWSFLKFLNSFFFLMSTNKSSSAHPLGPQYQPPFTPARQAWNTRLAQPRSSRVVWASPCTWDVASTLPHWG